MLRAMLSVARQPLFVAGILLLLTQGCTTVESVKPIYKPKDVLRDDSLLGTWSAPDEWWILSRYPKHSYLLTTIPAQRKEERDDSVIAGPLDMVQIGQHRYRFLSVPEGPNFIAPAMRIALEADELLIQWIEPERWAELLENDPKSPPHRVEGNGPKYTRRPSTDATTRPASTNYTSRSLWIHVVMTGAPKEIRDFLIRHENDPTLFTKPARLKKAAPG